MWKSKRKPFVERHRWIKDAGRDVCSRCAEVEKWPQNLSLKMCVQKSLISKLPLYTSSPWATSARVLFTYSLCVTRGTPRTKSILFIRCWIAATCQQDVHSKSGFWTWHVQWLDCGKICVVQLFQLASLSVQAVWGTSIGALVWAVISF